MGLALSLAGALVWRSSVLARERQTFQTNATEVSQRLQGTVRRDTDFVASLRSVLSLEPHLSPSGYKRWLGELEGSRQQLGGFGALVVSDVPAADLSSFEAHRDADPAFRTLVGGRVEPVQQTGRANYCLLSGGSADITYNREVDAVLQGDWCDPTSLIGGFEQSGTTRAHFTQMITERGQFVAYTAALGGITTLIVESAFYRAGAPLASAAERRASVQGWILGSFDISQLLQSALGQPPRPCGDPLPQQRRPGNGIRGQGRRRTPHLLAAHDALGRRQLGGARGRRRPLGGPSANVQALAVLLVGAIVSALLCALTLVLTRSREHALAMVEEKTGQLRHQALHDSLTGLPNRVLALERAAQMLARARRGDRPIAALYVDVDGFKQVNDSFGHAAGDELLRQVAGRLATVVREGDTAARLGGDEFVVLVEGSTLDAGPELVAERLLEVLRAPYDLGGEIGRELTITASVGIAFGLRETPDELLRDADLALYEAKARGPRSLRAVRLGDADSGPGPPGDAAGPRQRARARAAVPALPAHLRPAVRARVGPRGAAALAPPERGVLAPADFLPIAEDSGLIVPIGRWVLHEACSQAAQWRERGYEVGDRGQHLPAPARRRRADRRRARALGESGLRAAALTLEIAETTLVRDPERSAARLHELKALGVRMAIDDFGTGYSSLAQLHHFPADALKIDRSFISGVSRRRAVGRRDRHAGAARQAARDRHARRGHRGARPAAERSARALRPRPGLPALAPARRRGGRSVPGRRRRPRAAPARRLSAGPRPHGRPACRARPNMSSMESSQPGWLLLGLRYVLPAVVVLAGLALMAMGGETDLEGGASIVSAGLAIYFLNWLFRAGVAGDREREREHAAREYFDRHGRWPD